MELLKKLMAEKLFSNFNLVGGTALALQLGHRNSVDIDLFGNYDIDADQFTNKISEFGSVTTTQTSKNILITKINEIKVDFVNYKYPLLSDALLVDGIRMLSTKDIAAMKLNAIVGRGSKKDFIDLYYLLNEFSLQEMMSFYQTKFHDGSIFMVLKSLTYFSDADAQITPIMFDKNFNWKSCKQKIIDEVCKL
jgi:predicted nucleotidyltransferase component of viral defense system